MNYLMVCNNKSCNNDGAEPYSVCIPEEAVLDDKNVAAAYCPNCNSPLEFKYQEGTDIRMACTIDQ